MTLYGLLLPNTKTWDMFLMNRQLFSSQIEQFLIYLFFIESQGTLYGNYYKSGSAISL